MSQIYKNNFSGPFPPQVPTSFTTDIEESYDFPVAAGTSVPIANVERFTGDNGIQTVANTNIGETNVIQVRFQREDTVTVGAVSSNILARTLFLNSTLTLQVLVAGFADNGDACGGYTTATIKQTGGIATIIDAGDLIFNSDASLVGANFTISTTGAQFIITVTGVALRTINWSVCLPGIVSTI